MYLGSTQLDKMAENRAFVDDSINLVCVTPEWIAGDTNKFKISQLQANDKVSLMRHIYVTNRNHFRRACMELEILNLSFKQHQ